MQDTSEVRERNSPTFIDTRDLPVPSLAADTSATQMRTANIITESVSILFICFISFDFILFLYPIDVKN